MSVLDTVTAYVDPKDAVAAAILIGGWLYHKIRGEKTKTVREILDDVVDQVLGSDGVDLENVKTRAEAKIREALAKRKVTGKLADALVHEFVEYAAGELARRFDLLQRNLDKMYKAVDRVGAAVASAK